MKIKRMISRVLCLTALLTFMLTVPAGASEAGEEYPDNGGITAGAGEALDTGANGDAVDGGRGEESENFFADLYGITAENADKIFAILSFIGTLVLALAYKKGLMPSLGKTIAKLADGVRDMAAKAEERISDGEKAIDGFGERISKALAALESLEARANELSEKLDVIGECKDHTDAATKALLGEVDMLSELLLASSIPEYRKEAVERRVAYIKKELGDNEACDR